MIAKLQCIIIIMVHITLCKHNVSFHEIRFNEQTCNDDDSTYYVIVIIKKSDTLVCIIFLILFLLGVGLQALIVSSVHIICMRASSQLLACTMVALQYKPGRQKPAKTQ